MRKLVAAIGAVVLVIAGGTPASATQKNETAKIKSNIKTLEQDITLLGSDVEQEIDDLIADMEANKVNLESEEQIIAVNETINGIQNDLYDYQAYKLGYMDRANFHFIYTPAIIAVMAWFNANGYDLAAELIAHARHNNDINSVYTPTAGYRVKYSRLIPAIRNSSQIKGDSWEFTNIGGKEERDLFYAIKHFNWEKNGQTIIIKDIYDFNENKDGKSEYSSVANVAIATMLRAQRARALVPYNVRIII